MTNILPLLWVPNSILKKKKKHQKQRMQWNLWILEHGLVYIFYFSHTHAQAVLCSVMGRCCWGRWVMLRGRCPAASTFPPGRAECLSFSLSLAWSFIIYRRDKIKQTQQNGVKSECCGSHIYTLSYSREGSWSRVCSTPCSCLPASLSKQQSGGNPLLE